MRPEMVENGIKFLRHPNVQATPLSERVSFLEQKGMTKEEIQEAIERYQSEPEGTAPSQAAVAAATAANAAQAVSTAAPMAMAAAAPMQRLARRRTVPPYIRVMLTISSLVGAATILGFAWNYLLQSGYFPWLRSSPRMLEADRSKQETEADEKEDVLVAQLEGISSSIQTQTAELTKLCTTIDRKEEELQAKQTTASHVTNAVSQQATMQAIAELKAEVTTLKALLLTSSASSQAATASVEGSSAISLEAAAPKAAHLTQAQANVSAVEPFVVPPQSTPRESSAEKMVAALKKFRLENSMDELKLASGILIMYVKNLVENPDVPRYRRIAPANANFKQKIQPLKHHEELLQAMGFESTGLNMEWKWHLLDRKNGEFDEHLSLLRALLAALQAVAAARGGESVALEEIAQRSIDAATQQRQLEQSQGEASKSATTTTTTGMNSPPGSLVPVESAPASTKTNTSSPDTDLRAFLSRLEKKANKTVEAANPVMDASAVAPTVPAASTTIETNAPGAIESGETEELEEKADTSNAAGDGPAYPKSFTEVMELIKKGETVPGIQEIEDRVSEDASKYFSSASAEQSSSSSLPPTKPWEKHES